MGDRYTLGGMKCGHCGKEQFEVYYAPSSGFLTHKCEECGNENEIAQGFTLRPITPEQRKEIYRSMRED